MTLRPFWRYYGGKWRAAPRYPKPLHDLNNQLTVVQGYADLLLDTIPPDDPRHADLQEIITAARAAIALVPIIREQMR